MTVPDPSPNPNYSRYEDGVIDTEETDERLRNIWVPPPYIWNSSEIHQWVYALYWAMAVTLGVGMDIYPHTVPEQDPSKTLTLTQAL